MFANLPTMIILCSVLLVHLLTIPSQIFVAADNEVREEPAFPKLFTVGALSKNRVHIVSESVSDDFGYETMEEFFDVDIGKDTLIVTNKNGYSVTHIDSQANIIFRYQPYTCSAVKPDDLGNSDYQGFWNARLIVTFENSGDSMMHIYGIAALWMNAGIQAKSYATADLIYSASRDIFKPAHKWTVKDKLNKFLIHFYFSEANQVKKDAKSSKSGEQPPELLLDMIQFQSIETNKTTRTLNILTFEYKIANSVYDSLLKVPVGYGCMDEQVATKAMVEFPDLGSFYFGPLGDRSHKLELEATATKFADDGDSRTGDGNQNNKHIMSDTISVGLVRAHDKSQGGEDLQLIRRRDTNEDTKTIVNYHFNVEYKIDLRTGGCTMSNLLERDGGGGKVSLQFDNDLSLDMDADMMKVVFADIGEFYYVKRTINSANSIEYLYFERSANNLFKNRPARIMRAYSTASGENELKLEGVTIWVFVDELRRDILESYQLNIVEMSELDTQMELAKIFDISEECYLNNDDKMVPGRDFAWIELRYSLPGRYNEILSSKGEHQLALKDMFYHRLASGNISFFRVPRLEVMYEDTGVTFRALLLDIPSLTLVYNLKNGSKISVDKKAGDLTELTIDIEHCADLCRLHYCQTMSYCDNDHTCLLSATRFQEDDNNQQPPLVPNSACQTLTQPKSNGDQLFELSMHRILSTLRHQNYGATLVPKMPEELLEPMSESGIDEDTYAKLASAYMNQFHSFVDEQDSYNFPWLSFSIHVEGVLIIMIPDKFELESDPMSEFCIPTKTGGGKDLIEGDNVADIQEEGQEEKVPPFHEGVSMYRYKINSFIDKQKRVRLFSGLKYDQCALACVDSRCSSFSYCSHRQECVITDIYDISAAIGSGIFEPDSDCSVFQRDFLSKFNRFQGASRRPTAYKKNASAYNPSECAHSCIVEPDFRCLAFDYCPETATSNGLGACFYLEERLLYTGAENITTGQNEERTPARTQLASSGCDHYSRSYLADFVRIEYRKINNSELLKLKSTLIEGRSVDRCAEICVSELTDCTAFEFCFVPEARSASQSCLMIESKPEGDPADYKVLLNETTANGDSNNIVEEGKFVESNSNCHIFSLRKDSSEAHLRDLALSGVMTIEEYNEVKNRPNNINKGLSIGGGITLYICMALFFTALGCGLCVAKEHNDYLRAKLEQAQILMGIHR